MQAQHNYSLATDLTRFLIYRYILELYRRKLLTSMTVASNTESSEDQGAPQLTTFQQIRQWLKLNQENETAKPNYSLKLVNS